MALRVNAQEYAEKWARRLKAAAPDIQRGIDRVTEAPGMAAARAEGLMKQKINEALDNGTWKSQVAGVSLQDWQAKAKAKGGARLAGGVDAAQATQVPMAERLLAAVESSANEARRLPKGTIEDSVNRAATFTRSMAAKKLRRPGA